ncbi:hypothetical protein V5799_024208 [Amblyomma americanum]|uniref:Uncharacterized protein n=1 Tax=Amblyomma americanum TaxID=6943 RepID=A0AAQ4ED31_AMBAM
MSILIGSGICARHAPFAHGAKKATANKSRIAHGTTAAGKPPIKAAARCSKLPSARSRLRAKEKSRKKTNPFSKDYGPRLQVWRPEVHLHHRVQVRHRRMPLRQVQEVTATVRKRNRVHSAAPCMHSAMDSWTRHMYKTSWRGAGEYKEK